MHFCSLSCSKRTSQVIVQLLRGRRSGSERRQGSAVQAAGGVPCYSTVFHDLAVPSPTHVSSRFCANISWLWAPSSGFQVLRLLPTICHSSMHVRITPLSASCASPSELIGQARSRLRDKVRKAGRFDINMGSWAWKKNKRHFQVPHASLSYCMFQLISQNTLQAIGDFDRSHRYDRCAVCGPVSAVLRALAR